MKIRNGQIYTHANDHIFFFKLINIRAIKSALNWESYVDF